MPDVMFRSLATSTVEYVCKYDPPYIALSSAKCSRGDIVAGEAEGSVKEYRKCIKLGTGIGR